MSKVLRIPELNTNSFWNARYTPSLLDSVKAGNSKPKQIDYNYQALKLFSNSSVQDYQDQQNQYRSNISNFSSNVQSLSKSAAALTGENSFSQKYVSASTGSAVSGVAKKNAKTAQYNVGVSQVATQQRNESKSLAASSYGAIAKGISTVGIKVGTGAERQVSVNVLATDNNGQALKKFATAINNSGAGVVAEVKTKDNLQYLSVTSKETGAENSFALRDIQGTSVASIGLTNKVTSAVDAKYTVDGASYQSATNKVSLDNGNVALQLNGTTTGTIKVNVGTDDSKIVDATRKLINNYNTLQNTLSDSDTITKRGQKALHSIEALVGKNRASEFGNIGISLDKSTGELRLDEEKLAKALASSPDKVKNLLGGAGSLGRTIERPVQEMSNTPVSAYIKPPSAFDAAGYSSSYGTNSWAMQQSNFSQGLFLNMMI